MYKKRTAYIESLIYSGNVSDEDKRLLQNGLIPEQYAEGLNDFVFDKILKILALSL